MALNLPNFFKKFNLFPTSRANEEGIGSRQKKTFDWSVHGTAFQPATETDDIIYGDAGMEAGTGTFVGRCPIELPQGATILSAVVYGPDTSDTWSLKRLTNAGVVTTMASGTFDTADITITNPLVDNENYAYVFVTGAVADAIIKARIEYTI